MNDKTVLSRMLIGTCLFACCMLSVISLKAQSVGIGAVPFTPTEMLHVAGNIRFSGALMPNNLPGSAGQVLISQGAGVAPIWSNTSVSGSTAVYTVGQNGTLTVSQSNTSFQLIPGLTYNLVLPSAANVMILTQGVIQSTNFGSVVDIGILINGNAPTNGGLQRVAAAGYSTGLLSFVVGLTESWNLHVVEALGAGSYTITVQARSGWASSANYPATIGSTNLAYDSSQITTLDVSTRKQGVLHIIVF